MYRLKTTANFNVGGSETVEEVIHDNTLIGKGTSESPLRVDQSQFAKPSDLNNKQDTLISGTNIKTINNQSILGTGNINIEGGSGGTSELSTEVKNAILDCFENVAWTSADGQTYYDALEELFFPSKSLVSISAIFNQGSNIIYDNASLDDLKQYLTVTALYDDESTETVTNYSLSGTLSVGISNVTVTYQGKTTTFNVNVTAVPVLTSISATYNQVGAVYTTDSLDSLKSDLVVKTIYSDGSEITINENDYTLSGTLAIGISTITVTYQDKTTTFNVTVSRSAELSSISATYTQSETVYTTDTLDSLKSDLVVTAIYSDSSTRTVNDYTLSGTLTAGTSTITVSYGGKSTTFNVTVTTVVVTSIDAVFTQGDNKVYEDTALNDLKQYLVVTANYNNGATETLSSSAYTLSGTLAEGTSTITVIYENLTDTFDVIVTVSLLPSEYQQVEWIEANNGPAIDTGHNLTTDSEIRCGMQIMGAGSSNDACMFGRTAPSVLILETYTSTRASLRINFGRTNSVTLFNTALINKLADIVLNETNCTIDGETVATFSGSSTEIPDDGLTVYIFGWHDYQTLGLNRTTWCRCSYFEIYDNGTLISNLIPCYRKSDGVIGMYDVITNTFKTNIGTGAFTKGENI